MAPLKIMVAISLFLIHYLLRNTYYGSGNLCIFSKICCLCL